VFYNAGDFNGDLSKWQVGKVTNVQSSTYSPPPPLQDRVFFWLFLFSFFFVSALILFLNNALPSFFFNHFYPWTFLCCCGAVFYKAGAFNGNLSTWQVGKVTNMGYSTYTLGCFYFPSSFCGSTNSIFTMLSPLFVFQPIFILGLFFVAVLQCFNMLVPSMVISPHGWSGK
jgi:surface protein